MEFEGGMGVCPPKMKGNGKEPGQKELHVGRRRSEKSRQRRRKNHWDGRSCPTSGNTNASCHWVSTINWRAWGSSKAAHPSDLVNIWLKYAAAGLSFHHSAFISLQNLPVPLNGQVFSTERKYKMGPRRLSSSPKIALLDPPFLPLSLPSF